MGLIGWIVFGAIAGWIASIIAGTNGRQGCLTNIVIGIVGAFVGGFVVELFTGRGVNFDFNFRSFGVAVLGSIILLFVTGAMGRSRRR